MSEIELKKYPDGVWMPIYTLPRNEKKLALKLQGSGIPVYLPLKTHVNLQPVISKGKNYCYKRVLQIPMFAGYLFASVSADLRSELYRDRSVLRVLPVTEAEEDNLLAELKMIREIEKLSETEEIDVHNGLQTGEQVTFTEGPFAGWNGVVASLGGDGMVFVNITSIESSIKLKYPSAWCTASASEQQHFPRGRAK